MTLVALSSPASAFSCCPPAAVSSCVHELLGGVVEHRGTDAQDLADDTKLLQRLYALNIMRLEGHTPDVALWTVRGAACQATQPANTRQHF